MPEDPTPEQYPPEIYDIATTDPVLGGPEGVVNRPHQELAARTAWLRQMVDQLLAGEMDPNEVLPRLDDLEARVAALEAGAGPAEPEITTFEQYEFDVFEPAEGAQLTDTVGVFWTVHPGETLAMSRAHLYHGIYYADLMNTPEATFFGKGSWIRNATAWDGRTGVLATPALTDRSPQLYSWHVDLPRDTDFHFRTRVNDPGGAAAVDLFIDDVLVASRSHSTNWMLVTIPFPAGPHDVRIEFKPDPDTSKGPGEAWVREWTAMKRSWIKSISGDDRTSIDVSGLPEEPFDQVIVDLEDRDWNHLATAASRPYHRNPA